MEFQAFDKQIDTLSSQKIPDTVTQILWLNEPTSNSLLTSNARGVKLWKIQQKCQKKFESAQRNFKRGLGITVPKNKTNDSDIDYQAKCQHLFRNGTEVNIHKLSLSVDKENFLTADINSICLWNLATTKRQTTFKMFENGPKTGAHNSAAISSASFNQFGSSCMFLYTLSNGDIHICDLRERSNFSRKSSQMMRTSAHM